MGSALSHISRRSRLARAHPVDLIWRDMTLVAYFYMSLLGSFHCSIEGHKKLSMRQYKLILAFGSTLPPHMVYVSLVYIDNKSLHLSTYLPTYLSLSYFTEAIQMEVSVKTSNIPNI